MSKVIVLSRTFPSYHPRAGQPTNFPDQVLHSLFMQDKHDYAMMYNAYEKGIAKQCTDYGQKHHTIRAGRRWKTGDKASLRVWSGRPYNSPQIALAPDVEVNCFDFEIKHEFDADGWYNFLYVNGRAFKDEPGAMRPSKCTLQTLAQNDGLEVEDLLQWFKADWNQKCNMVGQIICWNPSITYP